ncbi:hypothetical protein HDV04_004790 [Boothiomyces sp. JEL0838]|nr:hypothetical protein HDV04_004790 [Boothiomyces sp. JEL0838]
MDQYENLRKRLLLELQSELQQIRSIRKSLDVQLLDRENWEAFNRGRSQSRLHTDKLLNKNMYGSIYRDHLVFNSHLKHKILKKDPAIPHSHPLGLRKDKSIAIQTNSVLLEEVSKSINDLMKENIERQNEMAVKTIREYPKQSSSKVADANTETACPSKSKKIKHSKYVQTEPITVKDVQVEAAVDTLDAGCQTLAEKTMNNVEITTSTRPTTEESEPSVSEEKDDVEPHFFTRLELISPLPEDDTTVTKQSTQAEETISKQELKVAQLMQEHPPLENPANLAAEENVVADEKPVEIEYNSSTIQLARRKSSSASDLPVTIADIPPSREVAVHYMQSEPLNAAPVMIQEDIKQLIQEQTIREDSFEKPSRLSRAKTAKSRKIAGLQVEEPKETKENFNQLENIVIAHIKKIEKDIQDIKKYQTLGTSLETVSGPVRQSSFHSTTPELPSIPEEIIPPERAKTAPSNVSRGLKSILKKKDSIPKETVSRPTSAFSVSSSNISGYGAAFSQSKTFHIDPSLFKKFEKLKQNLDRDSAPRPKSGQTIRFAPETKNPEEKAKKTVYTSKSTQITEPANYNQPQMWSEQWISPQMAPIVPVPYYQPIEYSYPYYMQYPEYGYSNYSNYENDFDFYYQENVPINTVNLKDKIKPKSSKAPSQNTLVPISNSVNPVSKAEVTKKPRKPPQPTPVQSQQPRVNPYTNNSKIKRHAKDFLSTNPKGKFRQLYSQMNSNGAMEALPDDRWA